MFVNNNSIIYCSNWGSSIDPYIFLGSIYDDQLDSFAFTWLFLCYYFVCSILSASWYNDQFYSLVLYFYLRT